MLKGCLYRKLVLERKKAVDYPAIAQKDTKIALASNTLFFAGGGYLYLNMWLDAAVLAGAIWFSIFLLSINILASLFIFTIAIFGSFSHIHHTLHHAKKNHRWSNLR